MTNLIPSVYDGLGIGYGTAGRMIDSGEQFLLADGYQAGSEGNDQQEATPEVLPVFLHVGTGRRFAITVHEIASDTPGDPSLQPETARQEGPPAEEARPLEATSVPALFTRQAPAEPAPTTPTVADIPPAQPTSPGGQGDPGAETQEGSNRPEPLQSIAHEPQPEAPESNVPPEFTLNVAAHDAAIKPGEPLPTPPAE